MKFLQRRGGKWSSPKVFFGHAGVHPKYLGTMQSFKINNRLCSIGEQFQVRD